MSNLEVGVLGVVGVMQVGAGVGIFGRVLKARFGAGDGPPAGSVFGEFAHFDAASSGVRFATAAIASAGRHAAKTGRGIREKAGGGEEQEAKSEGRAAKRGRE